MGNDIAEILGQCTWADEGSYLGEVAKTAKFPVLVKVSRGQYQNLGCPNFASPNLISHLLLFTAGPQTSISAQCVKFKNQRQRGVPYGPTLAIPRDFQGHFEILSEDGKCVPPLPSVEALLQKFPDSCLLREPIKAHRPAISNNPLEKDGGHLFRISEKTRILPAGEVLVLVGEVSVPSGRSKVTRYLRCFDSNGQTVYLNITQKGKFSPLARHDSISGVHTTKNIFNKRMPMMVRLVDGKPPVTPASKNSSFKFIPELRLFSTIQEELIFALPLTQNFLKEPYIVPLPLSVPLKFQVCKNMDQVEPTKEFCRLHEKMKNLVDGAKNLIQIYDINLKKELRFDGRQWKPYTPPIYLSSSQPILSSISISETTSNNSHNYEIPDVTDYEDIDEIYDYVRGVKPAPPVIKVPTSDEPQPPEPPPIETIPTHKPKIGTRTVTMVLTGHHVYQRPCLGSNGSSPNNTSSTSSGEEMKKRRRNLYVKKSSENNNHGMLSGSPANRILFKRSPIFDFRYKSMNDLNRSSLESNRSSNNNQVRIYPNPQTRLSSGNLLSVNLSSHFGGGGPSMKKLPIIRPKSLTNLFHSQNGFLEERKRSQPKLYL